MQANLLADFNGLDDFSKKVDFYHWGVHWSNRLILGDSLFVGELTCQAISERTTENDIKKGFVSKRVPHVTLIAITNNEEIDTIHAKWQEELEPVRAELNGLLKQSWEGVSGGDEEAEVKPSGEIASI